MKKLQHHSLAMVLIKLLEVQIQPESRKKESWDGSDNSGDFDGDREKQDDEPELTVEQRKMVNVLKEKTEMIINFLIDNLSEKNQSDIHMTLNAYSVLQEFCDNETLFQMLIEEKTFTKLVGVCAQLDSNRQNISYALQLMN